MKFKIPRLTWSIGLLFYIFLFCRLGLYAYPSADDYVFRSLFRENDFWTAQVSLYMSWTGRVTNTFLVLTASQISYALLPWVTVALNLYCLYFLLSEVNRSLTTTVKAKTALLLQAAWFASVPTLNETFYWLSGMPYTWTATLSLLCLAGVIRVLRTKKRGLFFYLLCLLVFLNGMNLEPTCVMQIVVLFFLTFYFLSRKDHYSALTTGVLLSASIGAFLVMYLAPGTAARMGGGGRNMLQTLGVAAVFGGISALKFFTKPIIYVFLLFLPVIAENIAPFDQKISPRLKAWHVFVLVAMIAPFQQAIAGWATGAGLPARAEGLAIWIMGATWVFLWVFGYRNEVFFDKLRTLRAYKWRNVLLAVCLVLNSNFISLIQDLRIAPLYAAEQAKRIALIEQQKNEDKMDLVVPALSVKPKLLFFSDIRPSPQDWKNQSFAEYLGVRSISALPESMLDDEQAVRDFREGKISGLKAMAEAGDPEVQFMLGEIYDTTFAPYYGTPKDNVMAVKWYRQAAGQGYAHACRRLTRLYALGMGVPKNYLYALGWLLRSQF